jgi:hypothetical protein
MLATMRLQMLGFMGNRPVCQFKLKAIGALVAIAIALVLSVGISFGISVAGAIAATTPTITVYRDPSCSCCEGWIDHLSAQGFHLETIETPDVEPLKHQYGVPTELQSCHTAILDGYVLEGHVPVEDIKRLLADHPAIVGLAVPGMPVGTPGMESDDQHDSFNVMAFDQQGTTTVFNEYSF